MWDFILDLKLYYCLVRWSINRRRNMEPLLIFWSPALVGGLVLALLMARNRGDHHPLVPPRGSRPRRPR